MSTFAARFFVAGAAAIVSLSGCSHDPQPEQPASLTPGNPVQEVDAPIEQLLTADKPHCFRSAVEAVAAQLRAARHIDRENDAAEREYEQHGTLKPPTVTVGDVENKCYSVTPYPPQK